MKFRHIPVFTREEARESRPHPEEPRFRVLDRGKGSFPCVDVIEFPAFPSHLKSRRSPQEKQEEFREVPEQLAWGLAFPEATIAGP